MLDGFCWSLDISDTCRIDSLILTFSDSKFNLDPFSEKLRQTLLEKAGFSKFLKGTFLVILVQKDFSLMTVLI